MSMQDPIADMLTRIRNAHAAKKNEVFFPSSRFKLAILKVLKDEGYIDSFYLIKEPGQFDQIGCKLKYIDGQPVIAVLRRVSKVGLRAYSGVKTLPRVMNGLGILVLSTSRGVISDRKARQLGVGGEILCEVF